MLRAEVQRPPRVLALVHLPPPVHGAAIVGEQFVNFARRALSLHVIPLRFAREIGDLGRLRPRKLLVAGSVAVRQFWVLTMDRIDVGYITPAGRGGGVLRDALYMHVFRLFRIPYVVHVHTMGVPASIAALPASLRSFVRGGYARASVVVALNATHAQELESVVPRARIAVVPNGLPDAEFSSLGGEARRGRSRILFLSNLHEDKGTLVLLEALAVLRREYPHAAGENRPTFAGAWPAEVVRERFAARARELGVADWIELEGFVGVERKRELLRETSVFVFPSHYAWECMPVAVLEAMRGGLPVVATRQGGVPDLIGEAGVLVPPRDSGALAEGIGRLLADAELRDSLGQAARRRFEQRFLIETWETRITQVIREAAGGGRPGATGAGRVSQPGASWLRGRASARYPREFRSCRTAYDPHSIGSRSSGLFGTALWVPFGPTPRTRGVSPADGCPLHT